MKEIEEDIVLSLSRGFPVHYQLLELAQTHIHPTMRWIHEMPSNHLILCHQLLLPPSIFPSIRVFQMSQLIRSGG